jgi:NAD(P)-dependent dehydrogenase (short-subunit alcohol dehydrogenase family)
MTNRTVVRNPEGKVAPVTGATLGIGQAAAERLAAQGNGDRPVASAAGRTRVLDLIV